MPLGALAIEQVLGLQGPLAEVVGQLRRARWHGLDVEVLPPPHPSGASTCPVTAPGKTLPAKALGLLGQRPVAGAFRT